MAYQTWDVFKQYVIANKLAVQFIEYPEKYELSAFNSGMTVTCYLSKTPSDPTDLNEFESTYKPLGNVQETTLVTTQYELNDKDLKLARGECAIDPDTKSATVYIPVPAGGRYMAGGDGFLDSFDWGDYAIVDIEDKDRLLAHLAGIEMSLGRDATDEEMQAASEFTAYPIVKSFTDYALNASNQQGWYFWPEPINQTSYGVIEVEPIGGYGFVPEGFYIKIKAIRANMTTGMFRCNVFWGKKE